MTDRNTETCYDETTSNEPVDQFPFILAVNNGNLHEVKNIFSKINNADDRKTLLGPFKPNNKPALYYAAINGNLDVYEYLLDNGSEDNSEYRTILAEKNIKKALAKNAKKSQESRMTYEAYINSRYSNV